MTRPMAGTAPWRRRGGSATARRRHVVDRLAAVRLAGGPRALDEAPAFDGEPGHRLRLALEELGPALAAFGRYVGGRPDLLPVAWCTALGATEVVVEPLAREEVERRLKGALAAAPHAQVAEVFPCPLRSGPASEAYTARLIGGERVELRFARLPDDEAWSGELELLPLVGEALAPLAGGRFSVRHVVADFGRSLAAAADSRGIADGLADVEARVATRFRVRLGRPLAELSGEGLVALDMPYGSQAAPPAGAEAARRLCLMWLHLALTGAAFPCALDPRGAVDLGDGWIGLGVDEIGRLDAAATADLQAYLWSNSLDMPGEACAALLRQMDPPPQAADEGARLRQRFLQAVPFRDGGWGDAGGDTMAENLFVQWRLAAGHGFTARPGVVDFMRGLFAIATAARQISGGAEDPLREAVEELRLVLVLDRWGSLTDREALGQELFGAARGVVEAPGLLERAFAELATGRPRIRVELPPPPADRGSWAVPLSLVAVLVAVALVAQRLGPSLDGEWFGGAAAAAVVGAGMLLLRALDRPRRRGGP